MERGLNVGSGIFQLVTFKTLITFAGYLSFKLKTTHKKQSLHVSLTLKH